jgi:hypothetical protein
MDKHDRWTPTRYGAALDNVGAKRACPSCGRNDGWEWIDRTTLFLTRQKEAPIPMVVSICKTCGFRR